MQRRPQSIDPIRPRRTIDGVLPSAKTARPSHQMSAQAAAAPAVPTAEPQASRRVGRTMDVMVSIHHRPKPNLQAPHPMLRKDHPGSVAAAHGQPAVSPAAIRQKQQATGRQHVFSDIGPGKPQPMRHTAPEDGLPQAGQGLDDSVVERFTDKVRSTGKLAIIGIVMAAVLAFLSLYSLQLGELVIAGYAIVAIWKRLSSRLTFILALATFGGIIITQIVSPDSGIADNLAVYAFLLLCVGTIELAREVRGNKRSKAKQTAQPQA